MNKIVTLTAAVALSASAGAADAKSSQHKSQKASRSNMVYRNVAMPQPAPYANAGYKYGPYPEYPQSPPGGGY